MQSRYVLFGLLFGFVLSRAGATSYDAIVGMFRLTDLHLFGVIGAAVAVSAVGFQLFRRGLWRTRESQPPALAPKPMTPAVIWGGLLFGAGWAIAGTCPGTALAQVGEGHLAGLFTFAGILLGAYLHPMLSRSSGIARPAPHRADTCVSRSAA
jgi:hypothetical protein